MATVDLAPGNHTAVYSADGYTDLHIQFNVSDSGVVTCQTVIGGVGGACNKTTPPGCTISGKTLTGYMAAAPVYNIGIVSATTAKTSYKHGEEIEVNLSVKNTGNIATVWCYKIQFGSFSDADCVDTISVGQTKSCAIGIPVSSSLTPGSYPITVEVHPQGKPVTDTRTIPITVESATHTITFTSVPTGATIKVDGTTI